MRFLFVRIEILEAAAAAVGKKKPTNFQVEFNKSVSDGCKSSVRPTDDVQSYFQSFNCFPRPFVYCGLHYWTSALRSTTTLNLKNKQKQTKEPIRIN